MIIRLPEIAKSYRREPVRRGFRAYVPAESYEARLRREWLEMHDESIAEFYRKYLVSNLVREIGLHAELDQH